MPYQTSAMSEPLNTGKMRLKILVVEDHTPTRLAMLKLIRDAGAEVTAARDGEEALGYLLTQKFDVMLTDLRMPKIDGFELLAQADNLPASHRPGRIVAISGEYEAGALHGRTAVQFLPKPFNLESLLNMLGGKPN
jgi:two-component system, NtrC family, nitrogen regulation response regulator NtrX